MLAVINFNRRAAVVFLVMVVCLAVLFVSQVAAAAPLSAETPASNAGAGLHETAGLPAATPAAEPAGSPAANGAGQPLSVYDRGTRETAIPEGKAGPQGPGSYGSVKPVSPSALASKAENMVSDANNALGGIIVQLAVFGMLVSVAVLAVGVLCGINFARRAGLGGLLMSLAGLMVYWMIPVILGLIKSFAGRLGE